MPACRAVAPPSPSAMVGGRRRTVRGDAHDQGPADPEDLLQFPAPGAGNRRRPAPRATGHLVDAMGGAGALGWRIKPVDPSATSFCGVAVTCQAGPSDNLALFGALDVAKPGDVIVCGTDAFMGAAVTGDLLVGMARNSGVAALVTDGVVRDVAGIASVGLPVFCAGVSPNSPARNGPGSVGTPIVLGGVAVDFGDIVIGDGDGVVIVPRLAAAGLLEALAQVRVAEAALEAKVKGGLIMHKAHADHLRCQRHESAAVCAMHPPWNSRRCS